MESKAYEEALEAEVETKENTIRELRDRILQLSDDMGKVTLKYHQAESDLSASYERVKLLSQEVEKHRAEKRELELVNDDWERSKRYSLGRVLEFSNHELEEKLTHAEEYMIMYKEELDEVSTQNEIEIQRLKDEIKALKSDLDQVRSHKGGNDGQMKVLEVALQTAIEEKVKQQSELASRRPSVQTFDFLPEGGSEHEDDSEVNLGGQTIRVLARVRPPAKGEGRDGCLVVTPYSPHRTSIEARTKDLGIRKSAKPATKQFCFEHAFSPMSTTDDVFATCSSSIDEVLLGGSVCILAYGQTGSGKTYTMKGLMERALKQVLDNGLRDAKAEVSLQCVEVYNDTVRNLFTQESEGRVNKLKDFLAKATVPLIDYSADAVLEMVERTNDARTTKFTEANERSSRSHLLVTLVVRRGDVTGKLLFVDLAGSERLNSSKAKGDVYFPLRLKETLCINKSLTALQDVVAALEAKSSHVPYRNSTLTLLLQPVLAASSSKVIMMFMVSPNEEHLNESICTLSLGVRLKSVELGSSIRQTLKNRKFHAEQVERTLSLLEKEREEKFTLIRIKEKLERDLNIYSQALKEKDNKLAVLMTRVKQVEKENFEVGARLKKEAEEYKEQFHAVSRKLRLMQARIESERMTKLGSARKGDNALTTTPPPIIVEESAPKHFTSTSPVRETNAQPGAKTSQTRFSTSAKQWYTPTAKKSREVIPRPQSVSKLSESRLQKSKGKV